MKPIYRLSILICLLIFLPFETTKSQNKKLIGDTLTSIANKNMWVGKVFVREIKTNNNQKTIEITANESLGYLPFREENVEQIYNAIKAVLPKDYRQYTISCKVGQNKIEDLIPNYYRSKKEDATRQFKVEQAENPLVRNISQPNKVIKGLQNKHIAVWPSHGYYYNQGTARWEWQRPRLYQTVEDLYTESYVLPFLVPMLENAGANVLLPRERDTQIAEVIVDNDSPNGFSSYLEQDGKQTWQTGVKPGFAHQKKLYVYGDNPFASGTYRMSKTENDEDDASFIEWIADIPTTGQYGVYISYKTLENSASNVLYTVFHQGGKTEFEVNQTMYGGTWLYLGQFNFESGSSPDKRKVVLSNYSKEKGKVVTADAVKFGGGMGNMARQPYVIDSLAMSIIASQKAGKAKFNSKNDTIIRIPSPLYTQQTSNYPRFMEGSRYWLQWAGAPDSIYSRTKGENDYSDDFQSRGFWVNYVAGGSSVMPKEKGLNVPIDLALGFHTDAGTTSNDSIIGTLAICTTRNTDKKYIYRNGISRMGARDLTDIIQSQIVKDIRSLYDSTWVCRGIYDKSLSESRVPEVPTMLLELLSHQNFADMRYGLDPQFRFTVCRAIYKGMLKYFESVYGEKYTVQPLPVEQFSSRFVNKNEVELRWLPVEDKLEPNADAKQFIIYTRIDGGGFDNGVLVNSNHHRIKIEPDKIYSFKVAAVNEGGISFPSEILSVCRSSANKDEVMIINGFDRVSAPFSFAQDSTYAGFLNQIDAGVPYQSDVSFVGGQHEFLRTAPFINNDAPGIGGSYGEYEKTIIAGNSFDYPYIHGKAIKEAGYSFVSSSRQAVTNNDIHLSEYKIVDLILGKQRETQTGKGEKTPKFKTFPLDLQKKIDEYCLNGGKLLVSGAYFASDMDNRNDTTKAGKTFLENTLKCKLSTPNASVGGKVKTVESPYTVFRKNNFSYYNEPNSVSYYVESADAIEPANGKGYTICRYEENNFSAGVAYDNGKNKICTFAFPFETIKEESDRYVLMNAILTFLTQEGKSK